MGFPIQTHVMECYHIEPHPINTPNTHHSIIPSISLSLSNKEQGKEIQKTYALPGSSAIINPPKTNLLIAILIPNTQPTTNNNNFNKRK